MKNHLIPIFVVYIIIISIVALILTVADKIRAKKGVWRIPEAVLLTAAALGGSFSMYIIMKTIRHKTQHTRFMHGIPIMMLFHLIVFLWLLRYCGIF